MIPRTFLSTYAFNNQQQMAVVFLTDITGLKRWADYIPVKLEQGGSENSYANNGYVDVVSVVKTSTMRPFAEYVPVYVDNSASDAWQINATGYIPYGFAGFGDASMVMDFTNGAALDPRITFSRTSNATLTNSAGVIAYAPHNLLTYSEQFDNAAWVTGGTGTIDANVDTAPDGTVTADRLTTTGGTGSRYQSVSVSAGLTYTFSVYTKLGTMLALDYKIAIYNNTGASWIAENIVPSQTVSGSSWTRVTYEFVVPAGCSSVRVYPFRNGNAITSSTVLFWGAQLNVGALQPYYPTTVKNLLGYTQEFDNAAWTKTDFAVTANATTAPDGSLTADRVNRASTSNTFNAILQASVTVVNGTRNTFSCYVKADQYTKFGLREGATSGAYATFNLTTGNVIETFGTGLTASITPVGNGWYRCAFAYALAGTSFGPRLNPLPDSYTSGSPSFSWSGNTTDGIFIWGAQLSDSASLDPYVYNPVAAPAAAAYYGPRFDYDPVTLAPKGLLIEEQRTNVITFSEQFDNAAWTKTNATVTADAAVSPDGTADADKYIPNSATAFSNTLVRTAAIAKAASATTYTATVFAKIGEYNRILVQVRDGATSANNAVVVFSLVDGAIVSAASASGTFTAASATVAASVGNGWFRCNLTFTSSTETSLMFLVSARDSVATIGDGTSGIFIWGAQLEAGAFATSYIPTTTATVTRAADVATMIGANFSNWYRQDEGTLFVNAIEKPDTATRIFASITDGTTEGYAVATFSNTGRIRAQNVSSSGIGTTITGQSFKIGYSFESGAQSGSLNGSAIVTTTTTVTVVPTMLRIGCNQTANSFWNSHISRIAYYPRRLSNAELQGITS